ncbi:MAG: hypothetical protein JWM93_1765 [Frankiales bacterium]|nr:hypothetical protein [Frankiales bacterium]
MARIEDLIPRAIDEHAVTHVDPLAVIAAAKRGVRRRARRRAAVAGGSLTVVTIAALSLLLGRQSSPTLVVPDTSAATPAGSAVPWLDTPFDPSSVFLLPGYSRNLTVPMCTRDDVVLEVGAFRADDAATTLTATATLSSASGTSCQMHGHPATSVLSQDGNIVAPAATPELSAANPFITVGADAPARVNLEWSTQECTPYEEAIVEVRIGAVVARAPYRGERVGCPEPNHEDANGFIHSSAMAGATTARSPLTDLTVELVSADKNVVADGKLTYVIRLTPTTGAPVSVDPCFGFSQILLSESTGEAIAESSHMLNCAPTDPIPVAGREYVMQAAVPFLPVGTRLGLAWSSKVPGLGFVILRDVATVVAGNE